MKLPKKLMNPFLLALQGFILGTILYFATHPDAADAAGTRIADAVEQAGGA